MASHLVFLTFLARDAVSFLKYQDDFSTDAEYAKSPY